MSSNTIKAIAILFGAVVSCVVVYLFLSVEHDAHGHEHDWFTNIMLAAMAAIFIWFTVEVIRAKSNLK